MGSHDLGGVFLIDSDTGQRRSITSEAVFDNWGFQWSDVNWASLPEINEHPLGPNLTLLASHGSGVYLAQNGALRPIFDANTFNIFKDNWGLGWSDIMPLGDDDFASSVQGDQITFPLLVTYSHGGAVYYMDDDGKRPIQNAPTFEHWFGSAAWGEIFYTKNDAFLASYPSPAPWSVLVSSGGGVYIISNQERHPIPSPEVFDAHAAYDPVYDWNNIFPVSEKALNTWTSLGNPIS